MSQTSFQLRWIHLRPGVVTFCLEYKSRRPVPQTFFEVVHVSLLLWVAVETRETNLRREANPRKSSRSVHGRKILSNSLARYLVKKFGALARLFYHHIQKQNR